MDNFQLSRMRLEWLLRRLRSKPEVIKRHDDVIHEQLHTGKIKPVSMEEQPEVRKVRHLPYREITRLEKDTAKLRVVYDASDKKCGLILND